MPDPEFLTLKGLAVESCLWSGTAGLYRPGISPDSRPKWNGEFSLAAELPTIWECGYSAVRILDVGSLSSSSGWVAPGWPGRWLAQRSSGVTGVAELDASFLLAALRACLLLLLRHFLGRDVVRGAPDEPRVAMADAWFPLLLRTDTGVSWERTESLGMGALQHWEWRHWNYWKWEHWKCTFHAARWGWRWIMDPA